MPQITDNIVAEFNGMDVLLYYWYVIKTFMSQYSWQIRTAYLIIALSIAVMICLMFLFSNRIKKRDRYDEALQGCANTFSDAFTTILESRTEYTAQEILDECDATDEEFQRYDGLMMADLICHIRMDLRDRNYLPNLQRLAEITGARYAIEQNLSKGKNVNKCLQLVCTMPLVINEGILSLYTANKNKRSRLLARTATLIVSQTEPFNCLLEDMNEPCPPVYRINIHRILGWRNAQDKMMAPLLMLAETCTNTDMAAFLITEVAYWGNKEDKVRLVEFLDDKRIQCRIAAVKAIERLQIPETEDKLYETYRIQPQPVRRVALKTLMSFHSGKYTDLFISVFDTAPSHTSRMIALECLYFYTEESRRQFEQLYLTCEEQDKRLFDQVRAFNKLS